MNISAPFIVRPIATTLLTIGVTLLGLVAYFLLPIAGVPQVDVPTIQISRQPAGRQRRDDGDVGRRAAGAPAGADLGRDLDQFEQLARPAPRSRSSSISAAASTAPRRTCRPRSAPPAATCPRTCPSPPTYEKANPADAQLMSIAVTSDDLPIDKVDDYVENYLALQISRITGVGLVDYPRPAEAGGPRPDQSDGGGGPRASAWRTSAPRSATATVNAPKGTLDGPKQSLTLDATDQIVRRRGVQRGDHRLPQRRAGARSAISARRSTASRISGRRPGSAASGPSSSMSTSSPASTSTRPCSW